jgi:hypothetical protein
MTKVALILKILEHVPMPFVPEAAVAIEAVIATVHQEGAGSQLEDWRAALTEASEPWKRIHDKATEATFTPKRASDFGMPHGSTGD